MYFDFKIWNSQPCSWAQAEYFQGLRILPPSLTAQIFVVFEIWRSYGFSKKIRKIQKLQILRLNATAQLFYVSETWRFFMSFWNVLKKLRLKNFKNFKKSSNKKIYKIYEITKPVISCCQSTLKGRSYFQYLQFSIVFFFWKFEAPKMRYTLVW